MFTIPEQMINVFTHKGVYHSGHLTNVETTYNVTADQLSHMKHITSDVTVTNPTTGVVTHTVTTETLNESFMNHLGAEYVRVAAVS